MCGEAVASGRHGPDETFAEEHGKLSLRHVLLARRHLPLFFRSVQDQIEQLGGRPIIGEMAPCTNSAAELGIESLYRIGRIERFSYELNRQGFSLLR